VGRVGPRPLAAKQEGLSGKEGLRRISGSEERKKGERGLQIKEEENEGRIGRNDTMTEGRCGATERVKGGARRLVKVWSKSWQGQRKTAGEAMDR
jgi:hypothetical protein